MKTWIIGVLTLAALIVGGSFLYTVVNKPTLLPTPSPTTSLPGKAPVVSKPLYLCPVKKDLCKNTGQFSIAQTTPAFTGLGFLDLPAKTAVLAITDGQYSWGISTGNSNEKTTIPLTSQQSVANISVQVVPRQAAVAILNAEVTQPDGVWPSGVVKLYRDGDYIGQSYWQTSSDQKLNFSFG